MLNKSVDYGESFFFSEIIIGSKSESENNINDR